MQIQINIFFNMLPVQSVLGGTGISSRDFIDFPTFEATPFLIVLSSCSFCFSRSSSVQHVKKSESSSRCLCNSFGWGDGGHHKLCRCICINFIRGLRCLFYASARSLVNLRWEPSVSVPRNGARTHVTCSSSLVALSNSALNY